MYEVVPLWGGGGFALPQGINSQGQVAGVANAPTPRAFFFDGRTTTLLPAVDGMVTSAAYAVNESGQLAGTLIVPNGPGGFNKEVPFRWSAATGLQTVSLVHTANASHINESGWIAGGGYDFGNAVQFGWVQSPEGQLQEIAGYVPRALNVAGTTVGQTSGPLTGGRAALRSVTGELTALPGAPYTTASGWAQAVNDSGWIAGTVSLSGVEQPFAWKDGVPYLFRSQLWGGPERFATETLMINGTGQVLGRVFVYDPALPSRCGAWVWTPTGVISAIGLTSAANTCFQPYAINDGGIVVGPYYINSQVTAVAWTADGGFVNLQTRLVNPPAGLVLQTPRAISFNKHIVVQTNVGLVLLRPAQPGPPPTAAALGDIAFVDPVPVGGSLSATLGFTDVNTTDVHTAVWDWGDGSAPASVAVSETAGVGSVAANHAYARPGVYTMRVTVTDSGGLQSTVTRDVAVYDPSGGYVTGRGTFVSPAGAYRADTTLLGVAEFAFNSRYTKGASVPSGGTSFVFSTANINFTSSSYQWLVVSGARAQYKGTGVLNGTAGYGFLLTGIDGTQIAKGTADRFRIKIWRTDAATQVGEVIYDNQLDATASGSLVEGTSLRTGRIMVHK